MTFVIATPLYVGITKQTVVWTLHTSPVMLVLSAERVGRLETNPPEERASAMANQVVAGDIVRVRVICSYKNQIGLNIRYWRCNSIVNAGVTDLEIATQISSDIDTLYREVLSAQAFYEGVGVQIISPVKREEFVVLTHRGAGLVAGDPMPTQVCGLIKMTTGFAGRSKRGRMYIPFPGEASSEEDQAYPTAQYVTDIQAIGDYFTDIITFEVGANEALGHWWLFNPNSEVPGGTGVTAAIARRNWATQRRRGQLGRPNVIA